MDFLNQVSGLIGQPMNNPTIPGTNIRVPRWLDPRRIYQNPARLLDPTGVRGGILTGLAIGAVGKKLGLPEKQTLPLEIAATTPGGPAVKLAAYLFSNELINPRPAGGAIYNPDGSLTDAGRTMMHYEKGVDPLPDDYFESKTAPPVPPTERPVEPSIQRPTVPPVQRPTVTPTPRPEETYTRSTTQERGSTAAVPGRTEELSSPAPQPKPMNELAKAYLDTEIKGKELEATGELQRRLFEAGALGEAATFDDVMAWTGANPGLAYRVATQKGLFD